jgi:diguanylate cyclase (GGDEF)-like protein/PAS domain S-box-containing protein
MWALQQALLTSIDAAVLLADRDRVVLYANVAANAIIGGADADQAGITLESLSAPQGDIRCRLLDGLASDGRWEGEAVSTTSEGILLWHRLTISAVCDRDGAVAGYIAIGMNTTSRKKLEDALRRSQAELLASNRALRALLEEQYALTEQLGAREQALEREAQTDELTGLPNRRAFDHLAAETLRSAEARGGTFAIAIADLDNFKCINDTFGHPAGDVALVEIARILKGSLRAGDTVCRYGGDEFAIIMAITDSASCREACERVSAAIREQTEAVCRTEGLPPLSASIGAALYPAHGATLKDLIASADIALYVGKNAGRGRAHVHEGWERALRRAAV